MQTLSVYREWGSAYNQTTVLKDSNDKVKVIIASSIKQPKKNQKTIVINNKTFLLNWDSVNKK